MNSYETRPLQPTVPCREVYVSTEGFVFEQRGDQWICHLRDEDFRRALSTGKIVRHLEELQ